MNHIAKSVLALLISLSLSACGDGQDGRKNATNPAAGNRLQIVVTTPILHEIVSTLVDGRADVQCLMNDEASWRHGDLGADSTLLLRDADVVFTHQVEPHPLMSRTIEANARQDRVKRINSRIDGTEVAGGAKQGFSMHPRDVLRMLEDVERAVVALDPRHEASVNARSAALRTAYERMRSRAEGAIDDYVPQYQIVATDDPAAARVIEATGFTATLIDPLLNDPPTADDRDRLLRQLRENKAKAIALAHHGSETMREMIEATGKSLEIRVIRERLTPWPGEGSNYAQWLKESMDAVHGVNQR